MINVYAERILVWVAIGGLALLAYQKDAQLDKAIKRMDGLQQVLFNDHGHLEKRMDTIMKHIREYHTDKQKGG